MTLDAIVEAVGVEPYFRDEAVCIYHADCRDILPLIPKVDLVLTDPPYGIAWGGATWADDPVSYPDFMRSWLSLTKNCRAHFVWQASPQAPHWHDWFPDDFRIFAICKTFVQMRPTSPQWAWDPVVFWGEMPKRQTANRDWFISQSSDMVTQKFDHPSPRRFDAVRYLVNIGTEPNDLILDPFLGSGTTLRAAKDLGRYAIGIEIEEKYCEIAAKRMAQMVMPL